MLRLAVVFLVIALIAAFLWLRRRGSPLVGRREDTFRRVSDSRGAVLSGTRIPKAAVLGVNRTTSSNACSPPCSKRRGGGASTPWAGQFSDFFRTGPHGGWRFPPAGLLVFSLTCGIIRQTRRAVRRDHRGSLRLWILSSSEDWIKGNPAVPGGWCSRKPTWSNAQGGSTTPVSLFSGGKRPPRWSEPISTWPLPFWRQSAVPARSE